MRMFCTQEAANAEARLLAKAKEVVIAKLKEYKLRIDLRLVTLVEQIKKVRGSREVCRNTQVETMCVHWMKVFSVHFTT